MDSLVWLCFCIECAFLTFAIWVFGVGCLLGWFDCFGFDGLVICGL